MTRLNATTRELAAFLRACSTDQIGLERIKTVYRPYICPFDELIGLFEGNNFSVFDVGCGSGVFLKLLRKFSNATALTGVDIDAAVIAKARAFAGNDLISFYQFNGFDLPAQVKDFEYVTMIDVLHHIPVDQKSSFMEKLHASMSAGSRLILKDIDADEVPWVFFNKLHDRMLAGEAGSELSLTQTRRLLEETGFRIRSQSSRRMAWYPHFTLVCER